MKLYKLYGLHDNNGIHRDDFQCAMGDGTATHDTGLQLVTRVDNKGHNYNYKLYTNIYFPSPQLFGIISSEDSSVV